MRRLHLALVPLVATLLDASVGHTQQQAGALRDPNTTYRLIPVANSDSTFKIVVSGETLHVITPSMRTAHMQAIRELRELRALAEVDKSVIEAHDSVVQACTNVHTLDVALIEGQRAQIADLKALAAAYERKKNPLLSYEYGLGGNRDGPAVIGGIGLWRFRAFGTFQQHGSAVFAGVYAPIH
jgi:hypothetical protein